jgi:AraC-like DNA-binding protein
MKGLKASGIRQVGGTTRDVSEAEDIVARAYLPNSLDAGRRADALDMSLYGIHFGNLLVGRLTYGTAIRVKTATMANVHVNIPIAGHVRSTVAQESVASAAGEPVAFRPGMAPSIAWSEGCVQLCLMVPPATIEAELAHLLGERPRQPLRLHFARGCQSRLGQALEPALQLMIHALKTPDGVATHPAAARHVEALVLSSILLTQPHNLTDRLLDTRTSPRGAIVHVAELIQEHPEEAWSVSRLAGEAHVSVRTLQKGFQSQYGMPPTAYLKQVRLHRVREILGGAEPGTTTVQAVATRFGFLHLGRFAAAYKEAFQETPSRTLNTHLD